MLLLFVPLLGQQELQPECACSGSTIAASKDGIGAHLRRALTEASTAYDRALSESPARDATPQEAELARRFAPQLLTTASEPFELKDAGVVLHPAAPWIAYHLFWEDDIDFPDDNDPCDHEVIWVRLDARRTQVREVYTYFHGKLLQASNVKGRPRIWIQWGKHGSMPAGWDGLEAANRSTYERLVSKGRDHAESPLSKGWPLRFTGSWKDFTAFSKTVDLAARKNLYMAVSCLNNAVINRRFLRYNFAAKTEWPPQICADIP